MIRKYKNSCFFRYHIKKKEQIPLKIAILLLFFQFYYHFFGANLYNFIYLYINGSIIPFMLVGICYHIKKKSKFLS